MLYVIQINLLEKQIHFRIGYKDHAFHSSYSRCVWFAQRFTD